QGEVDDAKLASERHARLGLIVGQRLEPATAATREHNRKGAAKSELDIPHVHRPRLCHEPEISGTGKRALFLELLTDSPCKPRPPMTRLSSLTSLRPTWTSGRASRAATR